MRLPLALVAAWHRFMRSVELFRIKREQKRRQQHHSVVVLLEFGDDA